MEAVAHKTFIYQFGRRQYDLSSRTHIMGVLNVTPDSFWDGGRYVDAVRAVEHALTMIEHGADIIDVGGESTRPKSRAYGEGAEAVPPEEELRRVIPVIERLSVEADIPISVDTYKSAVAQKALEAGAVIVNDISGFNFDRDMPRVVAEMGASAVVMHIQGTPKTMQISPKYDDLLGEITRYLQNSLEAGRRCGVGQMMVDPGLGFGKNVGHNLQLIRELGRLGGLGYPVVVGPSRKSFIGAVTQLPPEERIEGSLAAVVACVMHGANIVRVHDVKEAKRAVLVADAIMNG